MRRRKKCISGLGSPAAQRGRPREPARSPGASEDDLVNPSLACGGRGRVIVAGPLARGERGRVIVNGRVGILTAALPAGVRKVRRIGSFGLIREDHDR